MSNEFSSKLLENAVNQFAKLPGIGKKTALRLVLNIFNREKEEVEIFAQSLLELKQKAQKCKICNNISDGEVCDICADKSRDHSVICVVENIKDIIAIEKTMQFNGVYHVLGGLLSPLEGVSIEDLNFESLEDRLKNGQVSEVILALSTTMEGDTTGFYLHKRISRYNTEITTIARGVGFGDELEYTDEMTLGKAIANRVKMNF